MSNRKTAKTSSDDSLALPEELSAYQNALAGLNRYRKPKVEVAFQTWSTDRELNQVRINAADETALSSADYSSLLTTFATNLAKKLSPLESWLGACRTHKLKGRTIPAANCPGILGRAKSLEDHAMSISKTSGGDLTMQEAKKLLYKYSQSLDLNGFESFLREAPLGKYIVWATFNSDEPDTNPFDSLGYIRTKICTALGLGHYKSDEVLIVLGWNHEDSGSPPLHRPTIADAEDSPHYRPRLEADALWGLTRPLTPNKDKCKPQPEVVIQETSSIGLRLPFCVV